MPPTNKPSPLRRALIVTLKGLVAFFLILLLTVAGAFFWLRTPSAANFVADIAVKTLAEMGLTLNMGEFKGPLPDNLTITNFLLADAQGPLLKADAIVLRLDLPALFQGRLDIPLVQLDRPELIRLPVLPADDAPDEEPGGGIPAIPLDIVLGDLSVTNGVLHTAALLPQPEKENAHDAVPPPAGAAHPPFPELLTFGLSGSAALKNNALSAALKASLQDNAQHGINLDLQLSSSMHALLGMAGQDLLSVENARGDGGEDTLRLSLHAGEGPGGPLAALLNAPDFPGYALRFTGSGPVRDWNGALSMEFGSAQGIPTASASPVVSPTFADAVLRADVSFRLQCETGSFWRDLITSPAFALDMRSTVRAGGKTPAELLPLFTDPLEIDASLRGKEKLYATEASIQSPAFAIHLAETECMPFEPGRSSALPEHRADGTTITEGLFLRSSLTAQVLNLEALAKVAGADSQALAQLPLTAFEFTTALEALADASFTAVSARGHISTVVAEESFAAEYSLSAEQDGPLLAVKNVTLQGLGILIRLSAEARQENWALQAQAEVTAKDHAPWQELLARLAAPSSQASSGEHTAPPPGGAIRLTASLDFPGLPEPAPHTKAVPLSPPQATGSFRLEATNMRWPSEQLAAIAGKDITALVHLSGGDGSPYSLRLEELTAGIFTADGTATLTPDTKKTGAQEFLGGNLEAALNAGISDLAPLAGAASGLSGPLRTRVTAKGPLEALELTVETTSPALTTAAGKLGDISLSLAARTSMKDGGFSGKGTLKAGVGSSPGGPIRLSSSWAGLLPGATDSLSPFTASLSNFLLQGAGLACQADLTAIVPLAAPHTSGPSPQPALAGSLKADVTDWKKLAAVSGAPLSGAPAALDIRLSQTGGGQSATLKASLPRLRMGKTGEPAVFFLRGLNASLTASDLFGAPTLDCSLQTSRGRASFLRWTTGTASLKGTGGKGAFSLALLQEVRRQGQSESSRSGQRASRRREYNPECLTLQGSYDLTKMELLLNSLAVRDPASRAGLSLQKTLVMNFTDGVRIKDLDAAFQPSGRLTAQADLASDRLALQASLYSLPFTFFRLFTPATLPDGQLSAQVNFSSSAQGPQGSFSIQSHMSATQAASGMAKAGTPAAAEEKISAAKAETGAGSPGLSSTPATANLSDLDTPGLNASGLDASGLNAPGLDASGLPAAPPSPTVFALRLDGSLAANPGPSAVEGAGVRHIPGLIWLRGNGSFGTAGKAPDAREGHLAVQFPLRIGANGVPSPDNGAPLAAGLRWNGPIAALWQVVPLPDRYLSGQAFLDASLHGTLKAPKNRVRAYLAGGRFEDIVNGILLSGINLEASNTETGDVRVLLAADDGQRGHLALETDLTGLAGQSANTPTLKVRGQLKRFQPIHRDDLSISLSGILGVNGPLDALAITGNIRVDEGEFRLTSQLGGSVPTLDVEIKKRYAEAAAAGSGAESAEADEEDASGPGGPTLALQITLPRYFYIRGMGLDSEWQGSLNISGKASEPSLRGSLSPVRGYMTIFSRDFVFTGGDISFAGGLDINPRINLVLTYDGPDITAYIRTSGTAKKPKLSLESRPPLPQDEVLSHVLFGKRTTDLSRFEAIQLANNMRELTGIGGTNLDVLSGLRKKTGLDMLRISGTSGPDQRSTSGQSGESNLAGQQNGDSSEAGAPAMEAGKYIDDNIYVGVEQGVTADSTSVRVEVELFPSITLQGRSSAEASEVGLGWKMDY